MKRALPIVFAFALAACTVPRTELLVLVDTDLAIPSEVDRFRIVITGPNDVVREADAPLSTGEDRPRWLGVVHEGGPLGPLDVTVTGVRGATTVIERRARTRFVPQQTVTLRMDLLRACLSMACADGQTCVDGSCEAVDVDEGSLPPWEEPSDRLDAGVTCVAEICNDLDDDCDDAIDEDVSGTPEVCNGADDDCDDAIDEDVAVVDETCNGVDDDCDDSVDEDFDLTGDAANCGTCGFACDVANGTGSCVDSSCAVATCVAPFDDCDGSFTNGCEANTDTNSAHCGTCDNDCRPPNRVCCMGSCARDCP